MSNVARKLFGGRTGQALVEFALVVPIFMLLVMGVIEFGRAWNLQQTMTEAAREGARRAAVFDPTVTPAQAASAIRAKIQAAGFDSTQANIVWQDCTTACVAVTDFNTLGRNDVVSVQLQMPYQFTFLKRLMDLVDTGANGQITLNTSTRFRKE
jgi:Flp pilus assembly protein TadG